METGSEKEKKEHEELEEFLGGEITSRHGKVNWFLAAVYLVLFVWALYYLVAYWGGLGPGLDY
jgi:hypothetical protein